MEKRKKISLTLFSFLLYISVSFAEYIISGYVYEDVNGDGNLSDKVGIGDVYINLYDDTKTCLGQTTTNSDGSFSFTVDENGTILQ